MQRLPRGLHVSGSVRVSAQRTISRLPGAHRHPVSLGGRRVLRQRGPCKVRRTLSSLLCSWFPRRRMSPTGEGGGRISNKVFHVPRCSQWRYVEQASCVSWGSNSRPPRWFQTHIAGYQRVILRWYKVLQWGPNTEPSKSFTTSLDHFTSIK